MTGATIGDFHAAEAQATLYGAPILLQGMATDRAGDNRVVVLETRFSSVGAPAVSGQVLLMLDRDSSKALLTRLGV